MRRMWHVSHKINFAVISSTVKKNVTYSVKYCLVCRNYKDSENSYVCNFMKPIRMIMFCLLTVSLIVTLTLDSNTKTLDSNTSLVPLLAPDNSAYIKVTLWWYLDQDRGHRNRFNPPCCGTTHKKEKQRHLIKQVVGPRREVFRYGSSLDRNYTRV